MALAGPEVIEGKAAVRPIWFEVGQQSCAS